MKLKRLILTAAAVFLISAIPARAAGAEKMNATRQYEANIFLSNFAEQDGNFQYNEDTPVADLVDFAHMYTKINKNSSIKYEDLDGGYYETLTLKQVNEVLDRFFDISLSEKIAKSEKCNYDAFYSKGKYYFPAADGESLPRFAVVYSEEKLDKDLIKLRFKIFELDLDKYLDNGITKKYYNMDEAAAEKSSDVEETGLGVAIVTPYKFNKRDSFRLVSCDMYLYDSSDDTVNPLYAGNYTYYGQYDHNKHTLSADPDEDDMLSITVKNDELYYSDDDSGATEVMTTENGHDFSSADGYEITIVGDEIYEFSKRGMDIYVLED
ncbi:MAG: hypothetical protein K5770_09755 [Lachnospiraceae bacterium]|nr:hypothetical protein [Lachnospiraceae bacterium]